MHNLKIRHDKKSFKRDKISPYYLTALLTLCAFQINVYRTVLIVH